ncbi:MAG: TIGR03960 family B12-binding radical SAM protein [Candidatus Omnitrophota bacterium]
MIDRERFEQLLSETERPGRYIGGEWNAVKKNLSGAGVRFALAFPDTYEVGMSYAGYQILYGLLNRREDVACERVFAPWVDFEEKMRANNIELFSLESRAPLAEFDIIGFSLTYEINYTNVLTMLDLAGIPIWSRDRDSKRPLIIAGGPCALNPEPMADFFDAFVVGEAEEAALELVDVYKRFRGGDRKTLLERLARIKGVYVPGLYNPSYRDDGALKALEPAAKGIPRRITKRYVKNLDRAFYPVKQVVPYIKVIHDRMVVEIMRGCPFSCKFCQAGRIYKPVRVRSAKKVLELARDIYAHTGYEEISLMSLSSGDYPRMPQLCASVIEQFEGLGVGVSLPSLRSQDILKGLPELISKVRKTGLTFAPEAGSDRMRGLINKKVDIQKMMEACLQAYKNGWEKVKLYFIMGLPGETDSDIEGIAQLAYEVSNLRRKAARGPAEVSVSVTSFIPKPHTDFQNEGMADIETLNARQRMLREKIRGRFIKLKMHDTRMSFMEGVFSRGDRRMSGVIYRAWKLGSRFDSWNERFSFDRWTEAFKESNLDPAFYLRSRSKDELLPWSHITC